MTDEEITKFIENRTMPNGEVVAVEVSVTPVGQGEEKDRMSFNLMMVHEHEGDQPMQADARGSYLLNNKETSYRRLMKVGTTPMKLDLGWVSSCPGVIMIKNNAGEGLNRIPSPEQAELFRKQHILVRFDGHKGLIVRSKRCQIFEPIDHSSVTLESTEGIVPFVLWVFPD